MGCEEDLWLFGYGSLIFRPDFEYTERHPAYVEGWARRFYQGSVDHRGDPGAPGRVATLLPDPGARCWGVAFRVARRARTHVLERLDRREVGGYDRLELCLYDRGARVLTRSAVTYVATAANPNFLGDAPARDIARQVALAAGPSGRNSDYVLRLAEALSELGVDDPHVSELAGLVRSLVCRTDTRPPSA